MRGSLGLRRSSKKLGARNAVPYNALKTDWPNGAASRVGKQDTAWNYRDATWAQVMVGVDPDPANKEKLIRWTKDYHDALRPYSAAGAYVNFMMDEGEDRVKATYGDNYQRLVAIKDKYDPQNLFRVNQNIKPSGTKLAA